MRTTLFPVLGLAAVLVTSIPPPPPLVTKARAAELDGLKVVRVQVADAEAMQRLERTVRDIWTEHPEGGVSEPETLALRDYLLAHDNVFAVLDMHSFGQLIMWPNGFTVDPTPDDATFGQLGSAMGAMVLQTHGRVYTTGPVFSAIYPVRGQAIDWTYHCLGLVSFLFELRPERTVARSITNFLLPEDQILPVAEEITPAIRYPGGVDGGATLPESPSREARHLRENAAPLQVRALSGKSVTPAVQGVN